MTDSHREFDIKNLYPHLIRPISFKKEELLVNENQVAGHAGFYSPQAEPNRCLKPFNTKCARGRREHLFYQLIEYFKRKDSLPEKIPSNDGASIELRTNTLLYKHFTLMTYIKPTAHCNCVIDESLFKTLSSFVAKFYHVKHIPKHCLNESDNHFDESHESEFLDSVYSQQIACPCYGPNPKEKSSCSRDYEKIDFLCLEDLTAHCRQPCIVDVKIGLITYDPVAIKEKVLEQSSKYKRLREFGFRILGMKLGNETKDKNFGKTLETSEQVDQALDSFFNPLSEKKHKSAVINQILNRLAEINKWFEDENINQLKFFSSSLLIVYDSFIDDKNQSAETIITQLTNSVRVAMIDFAHVFHVHNEITTESAGEVEESDGKDNNYLFGLRKLIEFFVKLNHLHHQSLHRP